MKNDQRVNLIILSCSHDIPIKLMVKSHQFHWNLISPIISPMKNPQRISQHTHDFPWSAHPRWPPRSARNAWQIYLMPQGLRNVRTNRWLCGKFSSFWMEVLAKDMGILQGFDENSTSFHHPDFGSSPWKTHGKWQRWHQRWSKYV